MNIDKTDHYYRLSLSDDELESDLEGFKDFFNLFLKNNTNFKNVNLILDFSSIINIDLNKILLFKYLYRSYHLQIFFPILHFLLLVNYLDSSEFTTIPINFRESYLLFIAS